MRRSTVGHGLLTLGALALTAGLTISPVLTPRLVVLPLDQQATVTATGSDVDWYDFATDEQRTGLDADVVQNVAGDPAAPDASSDVAVWSWGSTVTSTQGDLLNAVDYTVCLDRRDAAAVECDADQVNRFADEGSQPTDISGLTLTFPFGTEKTDYELYNPTTDADFTARFDGEDTIRGTAVYRFVQDIPETVLRTLDVAADLAGGTGTSTVTADVVYSNQRTLWVEPTSGVVVTAEEHPETVLRGPDGSTGITLLAGDFTGTDDTVGQGLARAEDAAGQIGLLRTALPWTLGTVGVLLLVGGGLLVATGARRPGRRGDHAATDDELQPVP